MTSAPERLAVVGTGLIGTSVALAAARAGDSVTGWDADPSIAARAGELGGFPIATSLDDAVADAGLVVIAAPIQAIPTLVAAALAAAPRAIVTDVGSVKTHLVLRAAALADPADLPRFVPGHPMGGSERSGPEHASASVVDGIVWAITPHTTSDAGAVARL
ncbi:MAG: prephenate dehydrogenase/arogenate dehydrogenase family protein, partial [Actinomycetota bacterium]